MCLSAGFSPFIPFRVNMELKCTAECLPRHFLCLDFVALAYFSSLGFASPGGEAAIGSVSNFDSANAGLRQLTL